MKKEMAKCILAAMGMLVMILDAKQALVGAKEGMLLCAQAIIPTLLPFLVLSSILTSSLTGSQLPWTKPLARLLHIPVGAESAFLVGLLGGYPSGAQAVSQLYQSGNITESTAQRMLGFCSNAGPAFIFGIAGAAFTDIRHSWTLWGIHIISAIIVAWTLPHHAAIITTKQDAKKITLSDAVKRSVMILAQVCGWVILFRILLGFMQRWVLWLLPIPLQVLLCGLLELANGCALLPKIEPEGLRFLICGAILSFSGICVWMQTAAVTGKLGLGKYGIGKILQTIISLILCYFYQLLAFPLNQQLKISIPIVVTSAFIPIMLRFFLKKSKKRIAIPEIMLYNGEKYTQRGLPNVFQKTN